MKNNSAFTLIELLSVLTIGITLLGMGGMIYLVAHFVAKIW